MTDANELIDTAWQARRQGRPAEAENGLLHAIAISRQTGPRLDLIRGLKGLAHVVLDLGQHERALPLYEEAVALSRQEQDPLLLAHTVRHLGDLHRKAGRVDDADRCYREALALYREAPELPPLDFANALRPAALLKEATGDEIGAHQLWAEARGFYDAAAVPQGVAECARHMARLAGPANQERP
jgi:tetratricopeptide (TPR) repeat protein